MKLASKIAAAFCIAGISATAASAQSVTQLRLATHLTTTAPGVVEADDVFIRLAEKLSNGSLHFQLYPGEQAGKASQMFDLVKAGAIDVGETSSSLVSIDKLPLLGLLELPGLADDSCSVSKAITKLGMPGGLVYERDLKPNGIRILSYLPYPPYGPAASRVKIEKVSDLKGLKMRVAGGLMEHTVAALGGVSVKMASPEVYEALNRGTIDTVLFSYLSVKDYDLQTVAHYGTAGFSFGTPGDILMMSERKFQSLTKDQQDALIKAGQQTSEHWCKYVDNTEGGNIEAMSKAGMQIHKWTPEQIAELKQKTKPVADEWAHSLERRGKPAEAALKAFRAELPE